MKKHLIAALAVVCLTLLSHGAQKVSAVELVTNGGFETGNFTGWTATNVTTNVWFNWNVTATTCNPCLDAWTNSTSPHSGSFSAWNGWAAGNPVPDAYRLRQTITIPNNASDLVSLRWWDRLQWNLAFQAGSTLPQFMIVNVLNSSTNAVLAEKYRLTAPAASQGPMGLTPGAGWAQHAVNLSEFKGQTIKIEFMCTVAQNTMGPGVCEFDDISLTSAVTTASYVAVGGRVTTSGGMGMANVSVSLTDGSGTVRSTFTGSMGYYNFDDVLAGENYVIDAQKKNYSFVDSPRLLLVSAAMTDVNFQASP
jgi:hypothetical protein